MGKRTRLPDHRRKSRALARHRRNRRNSRARKQTINRLPLVKKTTSPPPLSPSYSPVSHLEPSPDRSPTSFLSYSPPLFDSAEERLACFREPTPPTDLPPTPSPDLFDHSPDSPPRNLAENPFSPPFSYSPEIFSFPPASRQEAEQLVNSLSPEIVDEIGELFVSLPLI